MNRDEIIRMAREANFYESEIGGTEDCFVHFFHLAFAAGAAAERNKCRHPDCVNNGPEGKCSRWLVGECGGPV